MNKIDKSVIFSVSGIVLGLVVMFVVSNFLVPKILTSYTKAAPALKVSIANSYLIGSKILARADGVDNCLINVFAVDEDGRGVRNKNVTLSGVTDIKPETQRTDALGKASFEVRSVEAGQFAISAMIDGTSLPKTVKVTFRN